MRASKDELTSRFLSDLSETLDIGKTINKLGITKEEAAAMLKSLTCHPQQAHGKSRYDIYVDGASRGNPGKAGAGAVIKDSSGGIVKELKKFLGVATNNSAEYRAFIMAIEEALSLKATDIRVYSDSELLVRQLNGQYKVKSPELRELYLKAVELLSGIQRYTVTHIPREQNPLADSLANQAIDGSC
ncbi:MAG: ribonuclease HI family protein [Deltaproteobacteria bacterium]